MVGVFKYYEPYDGSMARKKKGGWYGEPGRHALARMGIKSKGLTPSEKELRKSTLEFLAEPVPVEKEDEGKYVETRPGHYEVRPGWKEPKKPKGDPKRRFEEIASAYVDGTSGRMEDMVLSHGMIPESGESLEGFINEEGDDIYATLTQSIRSENRFLDGDDVLKVADFAFEEAAKDTAKDMWRAYQGGPLI